MAQLDAKSKHSKYVLSPWLVQGGLDVPVITRAEGVYLYDVDDKRYLDLSSGLVAANLGHGHPRVVAAITEQAQRVCFSPPSWFHDRRADLGEALAQLAPWPEGARTFFTPAGANANDDAMKIARTVRGRPKILAAYRSFHGSSPGSGIATGENRRYPIEPGMPGVVHFFAPFPYRSPFFTDDPAEETARALAHLEDVLLYEDPGRVAAILLEPVVGSNGVIVYPDGYLAGVRDICSRHGIALIFDEVMTGFGRAGAVFAGERFGVVPDIITFAKGITAAYVPLGGVIVREALAKHFDTVALPCGHTYSGHPLAMAAGLATLAAYRDEHIFERARALEAPLRAGLERLMAKHAIIGEVRGVGAFFALEFVGDRAARTPLVPWQGKGLGIMTTLYGALRREGVYVLGRYNMIHIAPPLTISQPEIDEALAALDTAIGALEDAWAKESGRVLTAR